MNGYAITTIGILIIGLGSWISFYGQVVLRKADSEKAKAERDREGLAMKEKLQSVLDALGAAKAEESKRLTEEKISLIQRDLVQWAEDFEKNRSLKKQEVDAAKVASTNKEVEQSLKVRPIYVFAQRFIQDTIKAYAEKTGATISMDLPEPPQNFYNTVPQPRLIKFSNGAIWDITFHTVRPPRDENPPYMIVAFKSEEGAIGHVRLRALFSKDKLTFDLDGLLPDPSPYEGYQEVSFSEHGDAIKSIFRKLIEAQLASS